MDRKCEDLLLGPIRLTQDIACAVDETDLFKQDCAHVKEKVEKLANALQSLVRYIDGQGENNGTFYDCPIRHIMADTSATLEKTLCVVQRCKRPGLGLTRSSNVVPASDFRKVSGLLEASTGDVTWLLGVSVHGHYGRRGRMEGLPPIASTDPMLAWIWGQVALIFKGTAAEREDAANYLALLASEDNRNRKLIVEEGGVKALLKLLKHGNMQVGGRLAAANALGALGADQVLMQKIYELGAIPVFVHTLENGPRKVQAKVAWVIAKMLSQAPDAHIKHPIENIIKPLVALLVFETMEGSCVRRGFGHSSSSVAHLSAAHNALKSLSILQEAGRAAGCKEPAVTSLTRINSVKMSEDQWETKSTHSEYGLDRIWADAAANVSIMPRPSRHSRHLSDSYFHGVSSRNLWKIEREPEDPETQRDLKVQITFALWKLAENDVKYSRKIASARALECFAKLLEKEMPGDVLRNTVMAVMEMASAAERDVELRRFAFRPNSTTAKAVLDQLLRIVQNGGADLQVPCIKALGCLSRTFPAKETKAVIELLVRRLLHSDPAVTAEATLALQKFSQTDNFLHLEHSKTIMDVQAVPRLLQLVASQDKDVQVPALILLCNLATHAGNNDAFPAATTLRALKAVSRSGVSQIQSVREALLTAMRQLEFYQATPHAQPHNYH